MKILSWNVNGIRAAHKKAEIEPILKKNYDVICIQETKAEREQLPPELAEPSGYTAIFNSSQTRKGHSGVLTYVSSDLVIEKAETELGLAAADEQGRLIAIFLEQLKIVVINTYVPNGNSKTSPLEVKLAYYKKLLGYMQQCEKKGYEVIMCGDINVAHEPIDLARPDANKKNIGFLPEERAWIDEFIAAGFPDVYREKYPDKVEYTYWDQKSRARDRNVGWRIDYFFVSESLMERVQKIKILESKMGSDHCPVELTLV